MKGTCSTYGRNKSHILLNKGLKGNIFVRKASCKHGHCASMSDSAACDINKGCTVLKLYDLCENPKCNCQKQIIFTPKQFQLEGVGFRNTTKKKIRRN